MTLQAGTRLGPYEILAPLGAGGMGEVHRARDSRLGRDVALKVLPAAVSTEPDRLRRFEQEARSASALNHPNILVVFDIGQHDSTSYLVTELLEGETLRVRLGAGPIPPRRALEIAAQIARGLAAAHERGIVHRDLKPENLFLTRDGVVKILDFGLAKLLRPELSGTQIAGAATVGGTEPGVVLGTAGYMSPEQVRGLPADHRSDLFSFGAILYEMLSGKRAFQRDSAADTMAAILREDPPELPSGAKIPPALDRALRHCLEKDPQARFQSARDLAFQLETLGSESGALPALPERRSGAWRERLLWAALALALLATGLALGRQREPPQAGAIRFLVAPPEGGAFPATVETHDLALSPDGQTLALVAQTGGESHVWLRFLGATDPRRLAGTEGAASIFWSPDGSSLGFFADRKMKKIPVAGGAAQVVCAVEGVNTGTWGTRGTMLFTQIFEGKPGVYAVPASGGAPRLLVDAYARWVYFLPDGQRFLYHDSQAKGPRVLLGGLEGGAAQPLLETATRVEYAEPGFLVYVRDGGLVAQSFDSKEARLAGDVIPLAGPLPYFLTGWAPFTVSRRGTLAYQVGPLPAPLRWYDRRGQPLGEVGPPGLYSDVRISPDGRRAVAERRDAATSLSDLWLVDLVRGGATRFTDGAGLESAPAWSPDGERIAFAPHGDVVDPMQIQPVRGGPAEPALAVAEAPQGVIFRWPTDWGRAGLLFSEFNESTQSDIVLLSMPGRDKQRSLLRSKFNEGSATFSPDERWIAFGSDEGGKVEIYLMPAAAPGERWRVSRGAASFVPRWRKDGRELVYVSAERWLMAVPITTGEVPEIGAAVPLFPLEPQGEAGFDITADGQRILVGSTVPAGGLPVHVVLNGITEVAR